MKLLQILFLLLISQAGLLAQNGTIRGLVIDDTTGEPVLFANVLIENTTKGTTTDLDGTFALEVEPGTYNIEVSFLSYQTLVVQEVQVIADEVTNLNLSLVEDSEVLGEVVITSKQARTGAAIVNKIKQNSVNLVDGIAAETFSLTGDGDAAAVVKRVPGVTVQEGKHVFIRGLGDRYARTLLNRMSIPGLDPDKNTVQMDIFPSNIIDNIIVYKTFTPDLPGNFTGGIIDIATKDFPERSTFGVSLSMGYNPNMHFNDEALTYTGGDTDFLGFDDGTRELPFSADADIPSIAQGNDALSSYTRAFSPVMATSTESQLPDLNFSLSNGNQINIGEGSKSIGYIAALNYRKDSKFYEDAEFNEYTKDRNSASVYALEPNRTSMGKVGEQGVLWSALIGLSHKTSLSKYSLTAMRFQNGVSSSGVFTQSEYEDNPAILERQTLSYSQRDITNVNIDGKHTLPTGNTTFNWTVNGILSNINEPDIRSTPFEVINATGNDGDLTYLLDPSVGAIPSRSFRELQETNLEGKLDVEHKLDLQNGRTTKIKGGVNYSFKQRDYSILLYNFNVLNADAITFTGNPDEIFYPENIWSATNPSGVYVEGGEEPANQYESEQDIIAAYLMNEFPISSKLNAIYGARLEQTTINFTGQNQNATVVLNDETILDNLDLLPSLNLVYKLQDNMNLRASYNRTIARPTFKEKSYVQIQDFISGRVFLGNLGLERSTINNYDLRAEYFFTGAGLISLSGFYKQINDPIEIVAYSELAPDNIQAQNVDEATVAGIEFEINKDLFIAGNALRKFNLATNLTLVDAETKMSQGEYESRLARARDGETVEDTRAMVGQSPFAINAALGFTDVEKGWEANLSYNVQGKRLAVAGISIIPDVYELPFALLNFRLNKKIGTNNQFKISAGVNNILESQRKSVYQSYKADDRVYSLLQPGRSYTLGFSYQLK